MRTRYISALLVCALWSLLIQIPPIRAGSFTVAPSTIYGTATSFSASYPEFHFDKPATISLTVSVSFNNASVSAMNVTAIHIRLYSLDVDLNQIARQYYPSATLQGSYADAGWLSTDYYGSFPYNTTSTPSPIKIERPSPEVSSNAWSFDNLILDFMDKRDNEVEAKLYIQVTFICLDRNGEPLWSSGTDPWGGSYHWVLYSSEGEAPIVTIHPTSAQFWFRPEVLALIVGLVGLVLVITGVIVMRKKRIKTRTSREDTQSPPPPQQSS
jgi:hypothetical protein